MSYVFRRPFIKRARRDFTPFLIPVVGDQAVSLNGLDASPTFGSITVEQNVTLVGLDASPTFGSIAIEQKVTLVGLDSSPTFGAITIEQEVSLNGLDSSPTFGSITITVAGADQTIILNGLDVLPLFGSLNIHQKVTLTGLALSVAFGQTSIELTVQLTGLDASPAFGQATIAQEVNLTGQSFPATFGSITISINQDQDVSLVGIASTLAFGSISLTFVGAQTVPLRGLHQTQFGVFLLDQKIPTANIPIPVPSQEFIPHEIEAASDDSPEAREEFLFTQAETLRDQHLKTNYGRPSIPWEFLTVLYDSEEFELGSRGLFKHNLYGAFNAVFVKFREMSGTVLGGPVGLLQDSELDAWQVTNDISKSHPLRAIGLLAATSIPEDNEYGWVIVSGVNLYALSIASNETNADTDTLTWSGDGEVSSRVFGQAIGIQQISGTRSVNEGYRVAEIRVNNQVNSLSAVTELVNQTENSLLVAIEAGDSILQIQVDQQRIEFDALPIRVTALEDETGSIRSLIVELNTNFKGNLASLESILRTWVTATFARADIVTSLTVAFELAFAEIQETLSVQVTSNSAFAESLVELGVSLGSLSAEAFTQINVLVQDGTAIATRVVALEVTVNDGSTGVVANASAISSLDTRITTAEGDVVVNASAITALETTVNDGSTGVAANASAVSSLDTRVTTAEGDVVVNASDITTLEATVNDGSIGVVANATAVSSLDVEVRNTDTVPIIDLGDTEYSYGVTGGVQVGDQITLVELGITDSDIISFSAQVRTDTGAGQVRARLEYIGVGGATNASIVTSATSNQSKAEAISIPAGTTTLRTVLENVDGVETVYLTNFEVFLGRYIPPFHKRAYASAITVVETSVADTRIGQLAPIFERKQNKLWGVGPNVLKKLLRTEVGFAAGDKISMRAFIKNRSSVGTGRIRLEYYDSTPTVVGALNFNETGDSVHVLHEFEGHVLPTDIQEIWVETQGLSGSIGVSVQDWEVYVSSYLPPKVRSESRISVSEFLNSNDGVNAAWGIEIDSNGDIIGRVNLDGAGATSEFGILASKFMVRDPAAPDLIPFQIVGGIVYIKEAIIEDLSVVGGKLEVNAASKRWFKELTTGINISTGVNIWTTMTALSQTLTSSDNGEADLTFTVSLAATMSVGDRDTFGVEVQILRAGVQVAFFGPFDGKPAIDIRDADEPDPWYAGGSHQSQIASDGLSRAYTVRVRLVNNVEANFDAPSNFWIRRAAFSIVESIK